MRVGDSFDVSRGLRLTLVWRLLTRVVSKYLVEESVERFQVFRFCRALVSMSGVYAQPNKNEKIVSTVKSRPVARDPAEFVHGNRRATNYVLGVWFCRIAARAP